MPRRVRRRKEIFNDDGTSEGWEEYHDYIFPDEEAAGPNLKLLNMAKMWKAKQLAMVRGRDLAIPSLHPIAHSISVYTIFINFSIFPYISLCPFILPFIRNSRCV
jgi:hypothetical protein